MKLKRLLHPFKFMHRYSDFTTFKTNGEWYLAASCTKCGKVYIKKLRASKEEE